jgi:hypothetical protein
MHQQRLKKVVDDEGVVMIEQRYCGEKNKNKNRRRRRSTQPLHMIRCTHPNDPKIEFAALPN